MLGWPDVVFASIQIPIGAGLLVIPLFDWISPELIVVPST